ncbi:MAG: cobalamin biosynthesis protein CobW, partial [Lachnospiraceae bacterium]|nr:cobalamin biosynthesis protein CobW [Lachnospiraceae bacterium]
HHEHDHEGHEHHHEHDHEGHEHHHEHDHEGHEHHHEHDCGCGHDHHHHHHADDVFTSWGRETPKKFADAELEQILDKLANGSEYGIILRAKGIVPDTEGGWSYFDLTPEEYEIRKGEPDYTGKLCVIGSELKEEKLEQLFGL